MSSKQYYTKPKIAGKTGMPQDHGISFYGSEWRLPWTKAKVWCHWQFHSLSVYNTNCKSCV